MHFLLIFLLALQGGAFSTSGYHPTIQAAPPSAAGLTIRPNDGGTGPPDILPRTIVVPPAPVAPVATSIPRTRHDGGTGPPDHH